MKSCLFEILLIVHIFSYLCNALSTCRAVDTIIVLNSELITKDQNHEKVQEFLDKMVYDASSELSGVGLVVYNQIPTTLDASAPTDPKTRTDYTLLGLTETIGKNTKRTREALKILPFKFKDFYSKQLMSKKENFVKLNDALNAAHNVFIHEGKEHPFEALFIFDTDDSNSNSKNLCESVAETSQYIEELYYVQIDDEFQVDYIHNCSNNQEIAKYDALTDLYEITCPTLQESPEGTLRYSKKAQLMTPWSIKSCNLIKADPDDNNGYRLSPQSSIIVYDHDNDFMSYEVGYSLITNSYLYSLLPKECYLPGYTIVSVKELTTTDIEGVKELQLNVIDADIFGFIMDAHLQPSEGSVYIKPDRNILDPETHKTIRDAIYNAKPNHRRRLIAWDCFLFGECNDADQDEVIDVATSGADCSQGDCDELTEFLTDPFVGIYDYFADKMDEIDHEVWEGDSDSGEEWTLTTEYNDIDGFVITLHHEKLLSVVMSLSAGITISGTGTMNIVTDAILTYAFGVSTYGPDYEMIPTAPFFRINDIGAKLTGNMHLKVDSTVSGSLGIQIAWDIFTKTLTKKPWIRWIGPFPIVIQPKLTVTLDFSLQSVLEFEKKNLWVT